MKNQSGNVLFLILIAVALFAALSYAVTQSTQSGGGTSSNETSLINASALMQYPVGVKTAVMRMVIGGVDVENLEFNLPQDFDDCTSPQVCVFHPEGGGATYANAPTGFMASNASPGQWMFTSHAEVTNIGQSVSGSFEGNEIIAFLLDVTETLCQRVNEELGIPTSPFPFIFESASAYVQLLDSVKMDNNHSPSGEVEILGNAGSSSAALNGHHQGCYVAGSNTRRYVYYQVLLER